MATVLRGAQVIDGKGGVIPDGVVVIDGTRLQAVGGAGAVAVPPDAEVIDLPGCTVMPGLIDAHLHLCAHNVTSFQNYRAATFEVTPQLQMLYALHHAQMCLEMGFTTLRDQGWITPVGLLTTEMVAVRDAIAAGIFAGPRILVAGWAVITSSHFDLILPRGAVRPALADGPWELRKLARTGLRIGCDFIKTTASGGGGTDKEEPDIRNMTQEELDAVADEAHAFRKHCACHCFTPDSQRMAVRAGVDTIEHCVFTDDDAIALMKEHGKYLVPTLAHRSDRAIEARRRIGTPEFVLRKMKRIQPHTKETFQRLHEAGVKIAMGTDLQLDPEMGASAMELEIYVEYGMTPMEAILTATRNAAEAIHLGNEVGTLDPGKLADVIVVDGDPLRDIRLLQERRKILMVMKEGRVYVDRRPGRNKYVIHDGEWNWNVWVS
jgi:imidazolonepropionase-like amidohydrolase